MQQQFFATCPKSLEQLLEQELQQLGAHATKKTVAGVFFQGDLELAYRVCLWSRLANRVLFALAVVDASHIEALYDNVYAMDWLKEMTADTSFLVDFVGTSGVIQNSQFGAQKVKDAIVDKIRQIEGRRPSVDKKNPMLRINALLRNDRVTLSVDLSGESLHRRGYRLLGGEAPLKENLAAAVLIRSSWLEMCQQGATFLDPMCGSGTLLIEACMMAADIAPGLLRKRFGFMGWRKHNPTLWSQVKQEAFERRVQGLQRKLPKLIGYDISEKYIMQAQANIKRAGFADLIQIEVQDLAELQSIPFAEKGILVTNPPYGERMSDVEGLTSLYATLGQKMKKYFLHWRAGVLTGNPDLGKNMGIRAYKKYALFNGSIPCDLLLFQIEREWFVDKPHVNAMKI